MGAVFIVRLSNEQCERAQLTEILILSEKSNRALFCTDMLGESINFLTVGDPRKSNLRSATLYKAILFHSRHHSDSLVVFSSHTPCASSFYYLWWDRQF